MLYFAILLVMSVLRLLNKQAQSIKNYTIVFSPCKLHHPHPGIYLPVPTLQRCRQADQPVYPVYEKERAGNGRKDTGHEEDPHIVLPLVIGGGRVFRSKWLHFQHIQLCLMAECGIVDAYKGAEGRKEADRQKQDPSGPGWIKHIEKELVIHQNIAKKQRDDHISSRLLKIIDRADMVPEGQHRSHKGSSHKERNDQPLPELFHFLPGTVPADAQPGSPFGEFFITVPT